jgi:excisionase family DNA binding protein
MKTPEGKWMESESRKSFRYVAEQLGHERFVLISTGGGCSIVLDRGGRSDEFLDIDKAIAQVKSIREAPVGGNDELFKLSDVEAELKVTRVTLLRWIRDGKLAAVKVGQQWRVRRSAVDEMKESRS